MFVSDCCGKVNTRENYAYVRSTPPTRNYLLTHLLSSPENNIRHTSNKTMITKTVFRCCSNSLFLPKIKTLGHLHSYLICRSLSIWLYTETASLFDLSVLWFTIASLLFITAAVADRSEWVVFVYTVRFQGGVSCSLATVENIVPNMADGKKSKR